VAEQEDKSLSRRGHGTEVFGGRPVGNRVNLPRGATEPITVYVNGVEQERGRDYVVRSRQVVFNEPIYKESLRRLSPWRKLGLGLGVVGNYERNEAVDIEFDRAGKRELRSDVPIVSSSPGSSKRDS
jgi:hypothetical protein